MTMVTIPPLSVFPHLVTVTSPNGIAFNSTNEGACFVMMIPFTGTLTHVVFKAGTVTTDTTMNCNIVLWDVASSPTYTPLTASPYQTNSNGSLAVLAADDNKVLEIPINSGTGISATAGDLVAVLIRCDAVGTPNMEIVTNMNFPTTMGHASAVGYDQAGAGTFTYLNGAPILSLRYQTTGLVPIAGYVGPYLSLPTPNFHGTSSPDEIGNVFTLPYKCRVLGAHFNAWGNPSQVMQLNCRDASGTNLSSSALFNSSNDTDQGFVLLATPQTIAKNTEFSLTLEATITGSDVYLYVPTYTANADLGGDLAGINTFQVTFAAGASRTETNTKRVLISPIIDQIDDGDGAGAGGLAANPIRGFTS